MTKVMFGSNFTLMPWASFVRKRKRMGAAVPAL